MNMLPICILITELVVIPDSHLRLFASAISSPKNSTRENYAHTRGKGDRSEKANRFTEEERSKQIKAGFVLEND